MSAPETCHFQPGQLVECIDDEWNPAAAGDPVKGCIYTVSEGTEVRGKFFLYFQETDSDWSFLSHCFRPVQTPDIGVFRGLLVPSPASPREVQPA